MAALPSDEARADPPGAVTQIQLVCLDMAGTTVDDGSAVVDSFTSALADAGLTGTARDRAIAHAVDTMGRSKIEVFREILGDERAAGAANAAFEQAYDEVVAAGGVTPLSGVEELFAQCRELGIRICLTTGFSPRIREAIIERLRWQDSIDLALSPCDAGRGRPYPDMILTAVLRLGIDDVRQVAVAGDTVNDLWSGHHAGASIVAGVLTGVHDPSRLARAPHTHLLDSVAALAPLVRARSAQGPRSRPR